MNHNVYREKIEELENLFNSKYTETQAIYLWNKIQRWREDTFLKVISVLCDSFKPAYGIPLPLPVHFNEIREGFAIQEEQEWKKRYAADTPADNEAYAEYQRQVAVLMKKWTGSEDFRPKSSRINGKFICEICHRDGCRGRNETVVRNGCAGFLSEEKHKKIIASLTPEEIEYRKNVLKLPV